MSREEIFEEECVEAEIDLEKIYNFPKDIEILKYKDVYLAIYTKGILWVVLNEVELKIFNDLQNGNTLEYVFEKYDEESVINVITQLEAKQFENPHNVEIEDNNVYIYLTNNCNERCKHCYMYAGDIKISELSSDEWIKIITELKNNGCQGITFTGGEVTVYKNFELVIEHAHNVGLNVTVLSNGILWDEEKINKLSKYIDEIQISLDGYDKESYFSVRQYDGFAKAMSTVELFSKTKTRVSIAVTPLYEDLDKFIENFEPFANELLDKYPKLYIKLNHELIEGRDICVSEELNNEYKKKLKALVERIYPDYYNKTFVLNYENKAIRKNCGFGGISFSSNGDVYWCNRIHELHSNINIYNSSVAEIFEKSKKIKEVTSVDNTKQCKDCAIRYVCGGGCRMKYKNIKNVDTSFSEWEYECKEKEYLLERMIFSNEYFFE